MNGYSHLGKKKRMRSFFWKTIPEEQVRGKTNIWTLAARQQHHYQIDTKTIEELFGQQEDTGRATLCRRGGPFNSSLRDAREEITLLDAKRSMNIGIFLKQFKKSPQCIVDDIHQGRSEHYGSETLREFLKLLPESEEVKKLKAFSGDVSKLSLADSFLHCLIQVPKYNHFKNGYKRLRRLVGCLGLRGASASFLCEGGRGPGDCCQLLVFPGLRAGVLLSGIYSAQTAAACSSQASRHRGPPELMTCEELHSILHLVLQAGNIMNAGGYAGNAVGFKLSSLLKLADTKANKPGMNLLHFVAQFAVDKLAELERWEEQLQDEAHTLIDFFCEDKETMKLDECLQIFRDFCTRFNKAVKDNRDRELQELRQLQRLKELEQKRRSWAAGELGGFGRSSSENDVEQLTKKGAEDLSPFLRPRPTSPSYLPPNTRRSRLSLGTSADRELLTFLESATGSPEEPHKFNSLPRSSPRQARPTVAWMEPAGPRDHDSGFACRPQASDRQDSPPAWPCQLPTPRPEEPGSTSPRAGRGGVSVLRKRNSEPVGLGPARSPPLSPLVLGIKEHELVTGLAQFDLKGSRGREEPSPLTLSDFSPMELESSGDGSPQPLSAGHCSLSSGRGGQGRLSPALEPDRAAPDAPSSAALVSAGSSDPENKEPGPMFCISDATDCSLTLDCSEGTDSRPGAGAPEAGGEGDGSVSSGAGEAGGSQLSSNPASSPPGEAPAPLPEKSEPSCKGGPPGDRPARGKDAVAARRSSFREAAGPRPGARRGAGAGSPKKPSAKPLRNIPRQKPEDIKFCRSNSEEEPKPPAPSPPRGPPQVPSFARNTVASSSRCTRTEGPAAARVPGITRTASQRQLKARAGPEDAAPKDSGTLRRASSARVPRKGLETAEGTPEGPVKARGAAERASLRLKDSNRTALGKILNPLWK
ncbi:FH2 domain-containing protein 1 [Tupaia chinensis]|uniref:FH2 domain-containing protein 1 n=1 Tax=Tupaia chinensis TaxID=246437 RepID=L9KPY2_TUPCH|nr:FH2 domain-containing protein 1 [Tupaia chinensis]